MNYQEAIELVRKTYAPLPCHDEHVKHVNALHPKGPRYASQTPCGDTLYDYILIEVADSFASDHDHHLAQCPPEEISVMMQGAIADLQMLVNAFEGVCEDDGREHDPETYVE